MRSRRSVTMQPIGMPSRSLKLAMAFFARVTTGLWPVINVTSATVESIALAFCVASPTQNAKAIDSTVAEVTLITGQRPVVTRAKKAIANFKLREGMPIGCMVTLRRERMYEFLDRLIHVTLPRVRDFKGISDRSFDGRGNYSLGLREQIIFPEIHADKVEKTRGMTVTIATTAKTDREGRALLKLMGMPFAS